jgi:hypothetical protein
MGPRPRPGATSAFGTRVRRCMTPRSEVTISLRRLRPPRHRRTGPGVTLMDLPGADHGLQRPSDWRRSVLDQVEVFDRVNQLASQLLAPR